jgi:ubiquinol-cytochrome c reductase cytochrome b subunit
MSPDAAPAPTSNSPGGRLRAWLADRTGAAALHAALVGGTVPGGASLWHTFGSVAAALIVLELCTGLALAAFYAPSVTDAWGSVAYIQDQLPLGWFVRGLHSFGSSALIVVTGVHLLQVVLFGAYRRPRELNWMVGLALMGVVMLFALSGYLLPWDQKGYWAKLVEATITGSTPVVGGLLQELIQGGPAFGNLTLTHAYAFHAMLLPAVLVGMIVLHIYLFRRHGYTPKWTLSAEEAAKRAAPIWPAQAAQNAAVTAVAFAAVALTVVITHGAPLESPADPASSYLARPEWYAMPLYQLRMYFEGPMEIVATMIIPGIATGLAFGLPFLDHAKSNRPSARKPVMAAVAVAVAGLGALSALALVKDARDPAVAKGHAAEKVRADDARRLALKGMPPEGGLAVYKNDPLAHAKEIWDDRCAGCHSLTGLGGDKGPDLKAYNSRAWIRGFLENPDGPLFMGPAKLEKGMKKVEGTSEELDALTELVYSETGATDVDQAKVARGKELLSPKDCDSCHDLDGTSENTGPNLKGRGTLGWVKAVIADAGHPLLFGEKNKMPKFKEKLTEQEIEDLARFVMGKKP